MIPAKREFFAFLLLLLACGSAWAKVAYVNSASASNGSVATNSITITYTPTAGHYIVIGVTLGPSATTPKDIACADNNSNSVPIIAAAHVTAASGNGFIAAAEAISGATSYRCTWAGKQNGNILIVEYSGVAGVGANNVGTGETVNHRPYAASLFLTSTQLDSWAVTLFGDGAGIDTYNRDVGNLRVQQGNGSGDFASGCLSDNSGTSVGSNIVNTVDFDSADRTWYAIAIELYPPQ